MAKYTDRGFLRIPVVFSSVPLRLQPKPALAFFGYNRSGFGCNRRNIDADTTEIRPKYKQIPFKMSKIGGSILMALPEKGMPLFPGPDIPAGR